MVQLFSARTKFTTWRKLWLQLAKAQKRLGLNIKQNQIDQMGKHIEDIDFRKAAQLEKKLRHDVVAHIQTFAQAAPKAAPIIHLGATSCFVTDNTDLIIMKNALQIIAGKLAALINQLGMFAKKYRSLPTLGFTHFQPQASFLALFDGNHNKVKQLDRMVADAFGFKKLCPVTGQTYPRKIDTMIVNTLALVAQSAHKMCNDIRLLANLKEIEEPFQKSQVGSSAMPYKRNPMRCERATALSRFVISLATSPQMTAAEQWLERTLDDSANRRIVIPEAFLAVDGILEILINVTAGLVVYPKVITSHIDAELAFMATENILVAAVMAGGNRQLLHEKIRRHSQAATTQVKQFGKTNDLIKRLKADQAFSKIDFKKILNPKDYIGRAPQQVDEFIAQYVTPIRRRYKNQLNKTVELKV